MTGHDLIISLRRRGFAPACIHVDDWQHRAIEDGDTVCLSPADVPEQQDWRFVVGLPVIVAGDDPARVARIAAACGKFAKRVVASTHKVDRTHLDWQGCPTVSLISIHDTAGALTWQA